MTLDQVYKLANKNRKTVMWGLLALVAILTIPMLMLNFSSVPKEGLTTGNKELDEALETLEAITNQAEADSKDAGFEGMTDDNDSDKKERETKDDKLEDVKKTVRELKNKLDLM